jgi:murein DD-endopeptidase MepM/ murein hydrolase activator NlpD
MKYISFLLLNLCSLLASAQNDTLPKDYFRNPLDIPIALAGGFMECRPNHFHTGIDIKTNQRENLPVLAAAEGYISRISISHSGYGNCLYIAHPNGYTTVYGHLNDFYPELQAWMIAQQYKLEQWNTELFPEPGQFPVRKGQLIAYSGTTGGSTGPHLHFEIRDTKSEQVLNERLFGLPIADTRAPQPKSIAVYNARKSIYEQEPVFLQTIRDGENYATRPSVLQVPFPEIYIGVEARDYTDNSTNWLGIYQMKLYLDDELQAATRLQKLDFSLNRYVNAYADYKTKEKKGVWYQGLYRLPNNKLDVYPYLNKQNGALNISDSMEHELRIELSDPVGNKSMAAFRIRYVPEATPTRDSCAGATWNCMDGGSMATETIRFSLGPHSLYDDICFGYTETTAADKLTSVVQLYDANVPLQAAGSLSLKLNRTLAPGLQGKIAFVHHIKPASLPGNNPQNGMAAEYDQGWATAKIRTFGNYYAVLDTVAPIITSLQKSTHWESRSRIRFRVSEELTSVRMFRAELNGTWLRFVRAGDIYTYIFDDHCPKGENTLVIRARDENENERTYSLTFTR